MLVSIYCLTMLLGAFLLFWVQPLLSKMLLPLLGGVPAVWNTCMVFFQAMLLLGYCYAHVVTRLLNPKKQILLHLVLLVSACCLLPFHIKHFPYAVDNQQPIRWLLHCLTVLVGLPFFICAATSPLLQRWFSLSNHPQASDPYFLYSASNIGSVCALLFYPFLLEPLLGIARQSHAWAILFYILCALLLLCSRPHWSSQRFIFHQPTPHEHLVTPTLGLRLRWLLLAFAPSSLLLGVTTYLTVDMTAVPLLWVIPLALYLLTFIIVFSRKPWIKHSTSLKVQPIFILFLLIVLPNPFFHINMQSLFFIHILAFFFTALICHGELAKTRPPAKYLTEFYLWLAIGGLCGGIFNAIIAPQLFTTIIEYPLALVIACLLRPYLSEKKASLFDFLLPVLVVSFLIGLSYHIKPSLDHAYPPILMISFIICSILAVLSFRRPWRYGLMILAIILPRYYFTSITNDNILYQERNFYGILRVTQAFNQQAHLLFSGTTLHGTQFIKGPNQDKGLTYYRPMKVVFNLLPKSSHIAIAGLGVGTMSCFGRAGDTIHFFEIDPADIKIAQNPRYFTLLKRCPAKITLGDARLQIAKMPPHYYQLMVFDTFSSDAIPVHIVTLNAITLYQTKLSKNGIMAFHITNRHLNLAPVLSAIAHQLKLHAIIRQAGKNQPQFLEYPSTWVILTHNQRLINQLLANHKHWQALTYNKNDPLWTDDYSNIVHLLI